LKTARNDIAKVKNKILTFTSEPKPLLLKEEVYVSHIYSTDAVQSAAENPKIKYFIPKEGATIWTDNFAIPKSARHAKEAMVFIDYFLDPDNVMPILTENRLATPNKTAKLRLPAEAQQNPSIYPPKDVLQRLEFLEDIDDALPEMNRMWTELKS
jgi:spermidine/putrescine-binding protein